MDNRFCEDERDTARLVQCFKASVSVNKTIHFVAPDGGEAVVAPGEYRLRAADSALELVPAGGEQADALLIAAVPISHGSVSSPTGLSLEGVEADRHHLVLLLPGGQGLEAVGSYSGLRTRGSKKFAQAETASLSLFQVATQVETSTTTTAAETEIPREELIATTSGEQTTAKFPAHTQMALALGRVEEKLLQLDRLEAKLDACQAKQNAVYDEVRTSSGWKELPPGERWKVVFSGAGVLDRETGLVWEKSPGGDADWTAAVRSCAERSKSGRAGWHLPTVQELGSLAPLLNHPFSNVSQDGSWYWSNSTPFRNTNDRRAAWAVGFSNSGYAYSAIQGSRSGPARHVWCVRGDGGPAHPQPQNREQDVIDYLELIEQQTR